MLELAILGLLLESPMHGYELRKRLTGLLGAFRAFSYGSLYPTLRRMQADGLIVEDDTPGITGTKVRRARRVYRLTPAGEARFAELVADTGPQNYTDDGFGVHLAFFSRTPAMARVRILEGRRRQVEERRESLRELLSRAGIGSDHYTRQMHELSLETSEREVQWLNRLLADEASGAGAGSTVSGTQAAPAANSELPAADSSASGAEVKNSAAQQSAVPSQEKGEPKDG